ncbi:MAG: hypothetical protein HXS44_03050 [Theionarchaea archaeon]|nr:hypothetical protein [Theionarchaea archaeon]
MKVRVAMMVQDPEMTKYKKIKPIEGFDITREDFFLDGPITARVAVLDFDPETGDLLPGVRFLPPPPGRKLGKFDVAKETDIHALDFIRVNVFATVLKTMYMFEDKYTLGRRLSWAFNRPQLLIVPRAGQWANAYYERASHSLQLFYFDDPRCKDASGEKIYTCLSRDIIAHETAHAILDSIAPDLYDAITPQSLAVHEAIADLTALLMAFQSHSLRRVVLKHTKGSIERPSEFSLVAEEFGKACHPDSKRESLRNLRNEKNLIPGDPHCVSRSEPHELSEVLSGALYAVMIKIHEARMEEYSGGDPTRKYSVSGRALVVGAEQFKAMIFRALDYLPPGEISFADYGRAIIASDQASYPDDERERRWITEEFVKRHMVLNEEALKVKTNFEHPALDTVDLLTLVKSDWAAYQFANENRELLCIPIESDSEPDIPFKVWPRLKENKKYRHRDGEEGVRECLFKVSWDHLEQNQLGARFPEFRRITVGTTLAIDWDTKRIRAVLTSDHSERPEELHEQQEDRDHLLIKLVDEGLLKLDYQAKGPDGKELHSVISAEQTYDAMRVRGTARMLHITGRD